MIVIDCDTGRDDALAIWVAANLRNDLGAVVGSYGNTTQVNVIQNCAKVISLAGLENCQLFDGATVPSNNHKLYNTMIKDRQATSGNGICNVVLPNADYITAKSDADFSTYLTNHTIDEYIIIGSATNCARSIKNKTTIKQITMLGGRLDTLWQQTPQPDFNIACDPFALQELLDSDIPVRFVPLNATWDIFLDIPQINALQPLSDIALWAKTIMLAQAQNFAPDGLFRMHDPSCIIALDMPELFKMRKLRVQTKEDAQDFGRLFDTPNGTDCAVFTPDKNQQKIILTKILTALGFDI